jgi:hypothetical protein
VIFSRYGIKKEIYPFLQKVEEEEDEDKTILIKKNESED